MLASGFDNLVWIQVSLPLIAVTRVVARAGAIQPEEPGKAVRAQFAFEDVEGVPFELLVSQLVEGNHSPCSIIHDTGFRIGTRGLPSARAARLIRRSSVDNSTSAFADSAAAMWSASKGR